ncbi:hypothetical protein DV735_g5822, partial [Chaetothyriales sp. CBS 134920]
MHEFSLYGQVSGQGYDVLLQQLAGVARMQPQHVRELHLVYKSTVPPGLRLIPSVTNSDRIQNPEVQRVSNMLTKSLYYVHLVGSIEERKTATGQIGQATAANGINEQQGAPVVNWRLDFKDTPEPGTQVVTSRLMSSIPIEGGDLVSFMSAFGFEYVSRHFVEGVQFYDQDTTLFLHRPSNIPRVEAEKATDLSFLDDSESVKLVDASGAYVLQASIEAIDGTNPELKDRATRQLLALKDTLEQAIDLKPGDRLALDTRTRRLAYGHLPKQQNTPNSYFADHFDPSSHLHFIELAAGRFPARLLSQSAQTAARVKCNAASSAIRLPVMKRAAPITDKPISPPTRRKIQSTTSSKAVANFFKPASQKEPEKLSWRVVGDSLIIGRYGPLGPPAQGPGGGGATRPVKIAAFDLDDTIVSPAGGSKWARGAESWKWWHPSVPARLRSLHDQGYLVTIFSNQGNISLRADAKKGQQKDTASFSNLKTQLAAILSQLDLPISFYGATAQDRYRKPRTGMWDELLEDYDLQSDGAIDLSQSFYVGDAAGREQPDKRSKDHATSDRDLASNIGIGFKTPEEFFLGAQVEPYKHVFEPKQWLKTERTSVHNGGHAPVSFRKKHKQELVIACGSPGSGKSTYFWHVLEPQGFKRINQDILKSRDRCLRVARDFLAAGESVAIDNTNADVETRRHWIKLAQEFGIPIRCIRFTAPARLCEHNNVMNPEGRTMLPGIAFRSFLQRLQEPKLDEGFEDITTVDFVFQGSPEQQAVWSRYWVSKFVT